MLQSLLNLPDHRNFTARTLHHFLYTHCINEKMSALLDSLTMTWTAWFTSNYILTSAQRDPGVCLSSRHMLVPSFTSCLPEKGSPVEWSQSDLIKSAGLDAWRINMSNQMVVRTSSVHAENQDPFWIPLLDLHISVKFLWDSVDALPASTVE